MLITFKEEYKKILSSVDIFSSKLERITFSSTMFPNAFSSVFSQSNSIKPEP